MINEHGYSPALSPRGQRPRLKACAPFLMGTLPHGHLDPQSAMIIPPASLRETPELRTVLPI